MYLENCIEKNFHVSRERYIKAASFDGLRRHSHPILRMTVSSCALFGRGCNFALVKVNKGMQVDTLVPQAMKDVPSCEKRRGAAKKR